MLQCWYIWNIGIWVVLLCYDVGTSGILVLGVELLCYIVGTSGISVFG